MAYNVAGVAWRRRDAINMYVLCMAYIMTRVTVAYMYGVAMKIKHQSISISGINGSMKARNRKSGSWRRRDSSIGMAK